MYYNRCPCLDIHGIKSLSYNLLLLLGGDEKYFKIENFSSLISSLSGWHGVIKKRKQLIEATVDGAWHFELSKH